MRDEIADVDYGTFRIMSPYIFYDKNFIYVDQNSKGLLKTENKNEPQTDFHKLDDHIMYTPNYFYFHKYVNGGDLIEIPVTNGNSIIMYSKRDYFSIDSLVYFQGKSIEDVDFESFETFYKGDAVWYAKDKNNVYAFGEIIPNANPKNVTYNQEEKIIEEGDYIWEWSTTEIKTLEKVKKQTK